MILYRPTDGDVLMSEVFLRPATCFLMTQLGHSIPDKLRALKKRVTDQLKKKNIKAIDADAVVTGKDFLDKIWRIIVGVPLGVAIIHEDMSPKTLANVFYELGMMDALGKRTIVVKSHGAAIPSDFVRTEYIEADATFTRRFRSFLDSFLELESHFETMAEDLENNPLLSIDYLRRAFLVTGSPGYRARVKEILKAAGLKGRAKNSVEMLMARF